MSILPENPLRFPLLFEANLAIKSGNYNVAFNYMEKLVYDSVVSNSQLTPSEKRILLITLKHRLDSLREGQNRKGEVKKVCARILNLLDKVLIPLEGPKSETRRLYIKMKKDCYWYLAETRDNMSEKKEATRLAWRV